MIKTDAEIVSVLIDPNTKSENLVLSLKSSCMSWYSDMKRNGVITVTLAKKKNKRTLSQNALCWVLCDEIAKAYRKDSVNITKEEIYREHIREAGRFEILYIRPSAAEAFKKEWENKDGWGWVCDIRESSSPAVVGMATLICYYGSSTYNTEEFADLLNSIIVEAEALGIDTRDAREISLEAM